MSVLPASAALSIIQAVIKVRGQVDTILSVHGAGEQLPFLLPPVQSRKDRMHRTEMKAFFATDEGVAYLAASGLTDDFARFLELEAAGGSPENDPDVPSEELYSIFYQATGVVPEFSSPATGPGPGGDKDTLLAWYSVKSGRLSNRPVAVRLTVAIAGSLLEVAGANAGMFVSNPATKKVIETLIERFVTGLDDDAGVEGILKGLVVSVVATVNAEPALTSHMPALRPLLGALGDVVATGAKGKDFIAGLVSAEGFSRLLSGYLGHLAADPALVTDNAALQPVLAATLKQLAATVPDISRNPENLVAVLGAGLTELVKNAPALLNGKIGNTPLLAAVVTTLADEVAGSSAPFFQRLSPVTLLPALYQTALRKIAADPSLVAGTGAHRELLRQLVGDVAGAVSELAPAKVFSVETLRVLAARGIETLGEHPELLARNQPAAAGALAIVFKTGAAALSDLRLTPDEIHALGAAVLAAAAAHPAIANLDPEFAAVLPVFSNALLAGGLKSLLTPQTWRAALLGALEAVISHPEFWKKLREGDLLQPLAQAIAAALGQGNGQLLAGENLAATLRALLETVARRGKLLIEKKVSPGDLELVLKGAAAVAGLTSGHGIDIRLLPGFLEHTLSRFLQQPFSTADAAALAAFIEASASTFKP